MSLIYFYYYYYFCFYCRRHSKEDVAGEDEGGSGPVYANPTFTPDQHQSSQSADCGRANTNKTNNAYEVLYSDVDGMEMEHVDDNGTPVALYHEEEYNTLVHGPADGKRASNPIGEQNHENRVDKHQKPNQSAVVGSNDYEGLYSDVNDPETGHVDDYGSPVALYDEGEYNALVHGPTDGKRVSNPIGKQNGGDKHQKPTQSAVIGRASKTTIVASNDYEGVYSDVNDPQTAQEGDYGTDIALYDEEQYNALVHGPTDGKRPSKPIGEQNGEYGDDRYQSLGMAGTGQPTPIKKSDDIEYYVLDEGMDPEKGASQYADITIM